MIGLVDHLIALRFEAKEYKGSRRGGDGGNGGLLFWLEGIHGASLVGCKKANDAIGRSETDRYIVPAQ